MSARTIALVGIAAALAAIAGCSDDTTPTDVALYSVMAVPAVPDRTAPIDPAWTDAGVGVADGTYWAEAIRTIDRPGRAVVFELSQAVFGPACAETFPSEPDACADDYAVIDEPTAELAALADDLTHVSVVTEAQRNYSIDGAELVTLVGGGAPSASAPADFTYVPFPFVVRVSGGAITEVHQVWTP